MRTKLELTDKVCIWLTKTWIDRKISVEERVRRKQLRAHERALARKKLKKDNIKNE